MTRIPSFFRRRDDAKKLQEAALKIELRAEEIASKAREQRKEYEKNKQLVKEMLKTRDKNDPEVRAYANIAAMSLIFSQRLTALSSALKILASQLSLMADLKSVSNSLRDMLKNVKISNIDEMINEILTFKDVTEFVKKIDLITNRIIQQISQSASEESVRQADKIIEIASTELELESKEGVSEEEIRKKISELEKEVTGSE